MGRKVKIGAWQGEWPTAVTEAERALRKLGYTPGWTTESYKRDQIRFYLSGGEPITSGDAHYSALPLPFDFSVRFWFALDLVFRTKRETALLDQVGLVILGGTLARDAREIFRAEWEPESSEHAQPHWHVYGTELAHAFRVARESESIEELSEEEIMNLDMSRFHFAMSARWMDADNAHDHHRINAEPKGVERWLSACLEYSREQLEYVGRRALRPVNAQALNDLGPA